MEFDDMKNKWAAAKSGIQPKIEGAAMLRKVQTMQQEAQSAHRWTIVILTLTVIGLLAFFYYLAPMQDTLSRIGIGLMIGGLVIRIAIELISRAKAPTTAFGKSTKQSAQEARTFYTWRKTIHGPVTITILALYTIGFYALSPEFSRYFSLPVMLLMDIGYAVLFVVMFLIIRKGVLQELDHWWQIVEIEEGLAE